MRDLGLHLDAAASFLFVGAHCDDIEIGCGATALRLVERYPDAHYSWIVLTSNAERAAEARAAATAFLAGAHTTSIVVEAFRDGFLPHDGAAVKEYFEQLKSRVDPDVIFTHQRADAHQDHRFACELTWNTFRDHLVLEYETPKYDGDLGTPNLFVTVPPETAARKAEILESCYRSQATRGWFSESTFTAIMRLRGIECNAESGLAEAFYGHKAVIGL